MLCMFQVLDLSYNKISHISDDFMAGLSHDVKLDLSHNKLKSLPQAVQEVEIQEISLQVRLLLII